MHCSLLLHPIQVSTDQKDYIRINVLLVNNMYSLADSLRHQLAFAVLTYAMFVYKILVLVYTLAC